MPEEKTFNLITRPDFDGVVCAVLLREVGMIKPSLVHFAQPWEVQNGKIPISGDDVTANLPYVPEVHFSFDHHGSELKRVGAHDNLIIDSNAPSAARVVYEHFGGAKRFPNVSSEMMDAVDQADSANYGIEDILAPSGWTLLNFLMDPRTGLERAAELPTTHEEFMQDLVVYCQNPDVKEILALPEVRQRLEVYIANHEKAEMQLNACARVEEKLLVVDLREEDFVYPCNRFMIYGLFPEVNTSMVIKRMADGKLIEFSVGRSILDRSATLNIGSLMLEYGGGGLDAVGTCRIPVADADRVRGELSVRLAAG